jgi:hypothetical protein
VRIFAHPRIAHDVRRLAELPRLIAEAVDRTDQA